MFYPRHSRPQRRSSGRVSTSSKNSRRRRKSRQIEPLEHRRLLTASVLTDKPDYLGGSTAFFTASGFDPGAAVQFQVVKTSITPNVVEGTWSVTDGNTKATNPDLDGVVNGSAQTSWYVDPAFSVGATFSLTATGLASGLTRTATTTFTDASPFQPAGTAWTKYGSSSEPSIIYTFNADGSVTTTNTHVGPYDGSDDTYIGVVNNGCGLIASMSLTSSSSDNNIFAFDNDGISTFGSSPTGTTGYEGPGTSFSNISSDKTTGTINFSGGGLPDGYQAYFSLESPPSNFGNVVLSNPNLSIKKSDNKGGSSNPQSTGLVAPGTSITYTIVISNSGNAAATADQVTDNTPTGILNDTWTFVSSTGGGAVTSGSPSSGTGNLSTKVDLPVGATITFSITANIDPAASGTLTNTATVDVPCGEPDANGTATDTDNLGTSTTATVIKDSSGGTVTGVPGESVHDTATVTASPSGFTPTGTVTYEFFTTINGTGSHTDQVVTLAGGVVPNSANTAALAAGAYSYVAIYSGDSHYKGSTGAVEPLTVSKASPTFTTTQTPTTATAGSVTVSDVATFSGGFNHTGTITFDLQNASNVEVPGYTQQTDTVTAGSNTYSATNETVSLAAGTYHWHVVYSGDANNNGFTLDNETLAVSKASPTFTTTQTPTTATAGSVTVSDTRHLLRRLQSHRHHHLRFAKRQQRRGSGLHPANRHRHGRQQY